MTTLGATGSAVGWAGAGVQAPISARLTTANPHRTVAALKRGNAWSREESGNMGMQGSWKPSIIIAPRKRLPEALLPRELKSAPEFGQLKRN